MDVFSTHWQQEGHQNLCTNSLQIMYFSSTPFPLPQTGERGFLLSEVVAIWCYKIMYGENSGSGAPLLKCDIIRNKNMCGPDG